MKRYTKEQIKQVYQDAKDLYQAYNGKLVKAYDGFIYTSFTWYNAIREAWQMLRESVQELATELLTNLVELANSVVDELKDIVRPALSEREILERIKQLGLNTATKHRISVGGVIGSPRKTPTNA